EQASQKETIYTSYVVDEKGVLIGSITLEELILAPDKKRLKDFMKENPVCSSTHADQEEIAHLINYYELMVLPITDTHGCLVGIITSDDILHIMQEEVTEDFQRFTGINPNESSYLTGSLWSLIINRSGWVLGLLLIAGFTQDLIISYGELLEHYWMDLSIFFTVLVGVGGNVGSQSSILVIRGITVGEITAHNTWRLVRRALICGIAMGILLAGMLLVRIFFFQTGASVQWAAALSMVLIVVVSNLLGAILPIILKQFKIDPAVVSAPLISTLMDIGGLILYLETAKYLLL
ncbi:MAG: magnesium transporter, partial [Brevinema sp.]